MGKVLVATRIDGGRSGEGSGEGKERRGEVTISESQTDFEEVTMILPC